MPHLTAGFDDNGNPISRSGFMVPCRRHSDCYSCGRHPLTGQVRKVPVSRPRRFTCTHVHSHVQCYVACSQFFQCQRRHTFYDTVRTSGGSVFEETGITFLNVSSASASAFDVDMEEAAITGMTGVCVDLDSSMNEGCGNEVAANIKDGLIGCFDGEFVAKFLCGLSLTVRAPHTHALFLHLIYTLCTRHYATDWGFCVQVKHGDLSTVQTEGNLFWPRVLLNGAEDANGDGQGGMHLECTDPIGMRMPSSRTPTAQADCNVSKPLTPCVFADCLQKCRFLERSSRHGFGAPPACALCDQLCPSNLATTIMDVRAALFDDVMTVGRLIASCFGNVRATSLNLNPPLPLLTPCPLLTCAAWPGGLHLSVCGTCSSLSISTRIV